MPQQVKVTPLRRGSIEAQLQRIAEYRQNGANMIFLCEPSQLPEFHRLIVEEVWVNPDPGAVDIFQPSGAKGFALHLKALERLFAAAGGEWDHNLTGPVTVDRAYMSYRAIGWITREYGKRVGFRGDADMDLDVLKEQLTEDYEAKAAKGKWQKGQGGSRGGFVQWPSDREKQEYIGFCVKRDYRAKRDNRMKLVASDAKAVVIRKLLGLGGTYNQNVFKAPFVIVRCVVAPDYGDPETQKLLRQTAVLSATGVYGQAPALPAAPPFEMDTPEDFTAPETRTEIPDVDPEPSGYQQPVTFEEADRPRKIQMIKEVARKKAFPLDVITPEEQHTGSAGILAPLEDHPDTGQGSLVDLWEYLNSLPDVNDDIPF